MRNGLSNKTIALWQVNPFIRVHTVRGVSRARGRTLWSARSKRSPDDQSTTNIFRCSGVRHRRGTSHSADRQRSKNRGTTQPPVSKNQTFQRENGDFSGRIGPPYRCKPRVRQSVRGWQSSKFRYDQAGHTSQGVAMRCRGTRHWLTFPDRRSQAAGHLFRACHPDWGSR